MIFYFFIFFLRTSSARGVGAARLFFFPFFFPCSADHERDWRPYKVVFFGLATNALNVRNNNNNNNTTMKNFHPRYRPLSQPLSSSCREPPESNLHYAPCSACVCVCVCFIVEGMFLFFVFSFPSVGHRNSKVRFSMYYRHRGVVVARVV